MNSEQNAGFHPILEDDHPYLFVDSCVQIWPDADFANANRHGVTAYGVTAWIPHATVAEALEGLMFWHLIARRHDNLSVVDTVDDIRRAKEAGQATLLLASQDGDFIEDKLHRIEAFHRLGLRVMLFAYNTDNRLCGGALDRTDNGLSLVGELAVQECNRVGILIDCTHISKRASLEIMERSTEPVIFSHSNPRGMVDNPRNIDDQQIKTCAAGGGVVGLVNWGPIILKPGHTHRPTLDDFIEHIDYVAQMLGSVDNIGIGTDLSLGTYPDHAHDPWGHPDYWSSVDGDYGKYISASPRSRLRYVEGFSSYPEVINLIARLQERGYSQDDVGKILGENYLRVFSQVWC